MKHVNCYLNYYIMFTLPEITETCYLSVQKKKKKKLQLVKKKKI